jgi:hypothetical protein
MFRWTNYIAAGIIALLVAIGCSGGAGNPVLNGSDNDLTNNSMKSAENQKALWGYYDLYFDFAAESVEVEVNRSVTFNANVVQFLNSNPAGISFPSLDVDVTDPNFVGVDIDVAIAHPLGDPAYNGYDVMGVFIGEGSRTLDYNGATASEYGTDQSLTNSDGLTRWFNPSEFGVAGVLGYTPGLLATGGYEGSATLNPYKLYADELGVDDNAFTFVCDQLGPGNNVFSAGEINTRNYLLEFPIPTPNVQYGYAVVASWDGEENHPANTTETVAISTSITDNVYYVDAGDNGGNLIIDFWVAGYGAQPSNIIIESSVLGAPVTFANGDINTGTPAATYSCYSIDIPADNVTGTTGNYVYIIAEYEGSDYSNEFGVPNSASADNLAAYYYLDLFVADTPYNAAPEITSGVDGEANPFVLDVEQYSVTATDGDGDPLTYAWTLYSVGGGVDVFTDDPGNGDGTIDIDWSTIGIGDYELNCDVDDGFGPVPATQLDITCHNLLYHFDGDAGDGGMTNYATGTGPSWAMVGNYWEENGNPGSMTIGQCRDLLTPAMNIPSGVTNVRLIVEHSGGSGLYFGCYAQASGHIGYTTNNGTNVTYHSNPGNFSGTGTGALWLTYSSGANWQYNPAATCGNLGGYFVACRGALYYGNWTAPTVCNGGQNWGTVGSPVTSNFTCNPLQGTNNVRFAFGWMTSTTDFGGTTGIGWQLYDIKVLVEP